MTEPHNESEDSFSAAYEKYRLGTVHRYFGGTDASLLAVFAAFEILHNFKDFWDGRKEYAENWYRHVIGMLEEGDIPIHPAVYKHVFSRMFMTEGKRKKLIKEAHRECLLILEQSGLLSCIKARLEDKGKEA
jgi:hypothetical protein